ncbi:BglG family transcription antiterminator LicT [Clostridium vincentii]|uniref:Transcription antiterminator LicT n=1 Tax=Clostridium vincentii TaxID=52704 RepID=A0A2T0BC96_9CLOT|nr:PRD domain-containing protein [Clostridium vincentii]PRR81521.1 Transcription antiterminator LicT [Clostridium vincentii]
MKIEKILNNNVITVIDEVTKLEKVIMGRGLSFNKKIGEEIDETKIEKVFKISNPNENLLFQQLINEIPMEYLKISEKIISYAKEKLNVEFDEHIYISLTDHLTFAIKRLQSQEIIKNNLLWEIQRIYSKEYEIGLWAIDFIEKELDIKMGKDEAGFIALHIINASIFESMPNTMNLTEIVQDILNIVKYYFTIEFNENSISFDRLITHLKFFAKRVVTKAKVNYEELPFIHMVKENYKSEYNCALKIKTYVEKYHDYKIDDSELIYLSLHLHRVLSSFENE